MRITGRAARTIPWWLLVAVEGVAAQGGVTASLTTGRDVTAEPTPAEVLEYFHEVAFGAEYGPTGAVIHKWCQPISIQVVGVPEKSDRRHLDAAIDELRALTGLPVQVGVAPANVIVHFVRGSEFGQLVPGAPEADGYVQVQYDATGEIRYGLVLIATDASASQRGHAIREELCQLMGLLRDSRRYHSSIFYEGRSTATRPTALDRILLSLLYRPEIRPGMSRCELDALVEFD